MPKQTQLATTEAPAEIAPEIMEKVLIGGDLAALKPEERIAYYKAVCQSLNLNPLTRPFEYTTIDGKQLLYAKKDCTEQLRRRDGISVTGLERNKSDDGIYTVIAKVKNSEGREDEAIGAVGMVEPLFVLEWQNGKRVKAKNPVAGQPLAPDERAKRMMVAETKAKRRATLSLAGLGIPDESEIEGVINDTPAEPRQIQLEAQNAADTARVIEAGGTVEVIEPKKTRARKAKEEHAPVVTPWQDVVCHVGTAEGPMLGRKVSELPRKVVEWLRDTWMPKLTSQTDKDSALIDAVAGYFAANPEPEPEPTPEPVKEPAPVPQAEVDPLAEEDTAEPETEKPKMEWRSVMLQIPGSKYSGHTLGEFETSKPGFLGVDCRPLSWFRTFLKGGIPKIEAKGNLDVKDKILINAIKAACEELHAFDDVNWLDGLDEAGLRSEINRRFDSAGVSSITREKVLSPMQVKDLNTATKEEMRYILSEWENVEVLIEGEK